ncbi:MAG: DoxX family protein [Planctomycetota bacterium]
MKSTEVSELVSKADSVIARFMARTGHGVERLMLGGLFVWFGTLKVFGEVSATSIVAKTVYIGRPEVTVPLLGAWEVMIGICLWFHAMLRIAIGLLVIRLMGTIIAFVAAPTDVIFHHVPWAPTIQGQYLVKDVCLLGAALVIGGTVRHRHRKKGVH